jgi:DNA-binding MarR family transcriptional regulator
VARQSGSTEAIHGFLRAIWKLDHDLQRVSKRMEATVGLTGPQRLCLLHIGRQPRITPSELAANLHLDRGTITGILSRLERGKLVARGRNPDDARSVHLTLTAKGRATNRDRRSTVESAVRRAFRRMAIRDVQTAARVLATVSEELHLIAAVR